MASISHQLQSCNIRAMYINFIMGRSCNLIHICKFGLYILSLNVLQSGGASRFLFIFRPLAVVCQNLKNPDEKQRIDKIRP